MEKLIKYINFPASVEEIQKTKVGTICYLSGTIFTLRDQALTKLLKGDINIDLRGHLIFHAGPVIVSVNGVNTVKAIGPTTSMRLEDDYYQFIQKYQIVGSLGKGGMGNSTLQACSQFGHIYLNTTGGVAAYLARCIESVDNCFFPELGMPEAIWQLSVKNLPAVCSMDTYGNSLHHVVKLASEKKIQEINK